MIRLILTRLISSVGIFIALSILIFLLMYLVPGSVAVIILDDAATPENIAKLEAELGLDDPLPTQYARWIVNVSKGDFGTSFLNGRPVRDDIIEKFPVTLWLLIGALVIAVVFGLSVGILASLKPGSLLDRSSVLLVTLGISIPNFWLAVLLSMLFAVKLGWLPVFGYTPITEDPILWFKSMLLPWFSLGIVSSTLIARQMRGAMIEVLNTDYVRAARASGIPEHWVVISNGIKNAMIPVITVIGFQVPVIIGGSLIIELVFATPGLGSLTIQSVLDQDLPIVQAVLMVMASLVILTNLVIDISYGWLNPKMRVL
ncbi:MAG: ABC transporter permease [Deltaproteobacteria bacterium]|nr:MAG: ABC transporter permease [Deltaproteobacteria bacterium]